MSRFKIPQWVKSHEFAQTHYSLNQLDEMGKLRQKLKKFHGALPIVSIVIPVWNEEKNLVRTLSSFAEMELSLPTELIIVDNNSTDRTLEILDMLGVKVIQERRQGIAHARLAGLRASKGEYQLCGDGDSLYPPTWIDTMIMPLVKDKSIMCVYGNYSFIPAGHLSRMSLGFYELMAECLFEFRRLNREFLNVRGANFGFRVKQGLAVKGFEMPITRVFDNDAKSTGFVVYGEDGRMGRKLSEFGKLQLVRSSKARIWTSSRRLLKDGTLQQAFVKRLKQESARLLEYAFGSSKLKVTSDTLLSHPK
jgi:glycosyltransferase involved in cell wall biosynthesis